MSEATTIELPQVSFGRYLDLLKRRRWQVIPVSLLGLVVGGMVAFFIPRYYVAQTVLEYYRQPYEVQAAPMEDPFKYVVDNATIMLPQACGATMAKLGWSESREPDPSRRRDFEREVEQRVAVYDINPDSRRTYAQIVVTYRDRDGQRAARFLNQLVATWMEQRLTEMRRQAEDQGNRANQHMSAAGGEWNTINRDLTQIAVQHGFNRLMSDGAQQEELRLRNEALQARITKTIEVDSEIAVLEQRIETLQRQIDSTLRTIDPSSQALRDRFPADSDEAKMFVELKARESGVKIMGEAHPELGAYKAAIVELQGKLEAALARGGAALNPAIARLSKDKDEAKEKLAAATRTQQALQAAVAAEAERNQQRAQATQEYLAKLRALGEAEKKRTDATEELKAAIRVQGQLDSAPPIRQMSEATEPQRPTEPNIFLIAVLGCVVGLGVAIGLILLIDMLQGTLKTVDDIERSLPVPVLGGVSHLETVEERQRATSSRRRASLVAGLLLFGAVVVVTTYYVAPHRLPPFARDLLSLVLGG